MDYKGDTYYETYNERNNGIAYPFHILKQSSHLMDNVVGSHYHDFIEMLYCLEGQYNIVIDGQNYCYSKGDLVIINSMEVHHITALGHSENQHIVIRFSPELLYTTSQTIFEAKYIMPFTMKTWSHQKIFKEKQLSNTFIPQAILEIYNESSHKNYGYELAIRNYIGNIFLWMIRFWHSRGMDLNRQDQLNIKSLRKLEKVLEHIDLNYDQPLQAKDMAKLSNMSYSYFSRIFKKTVKKSFTDYVNLVRITKSEHLLTTTDKTITEIATEVGFSTSSYFIEQFKRFKAITPKKYRSKYIDT